MSGYKYCVRTYVCVYRVTFRVTCANKCVCELRQPSYTAQIRIIEYSQTSLSEQTTVQMGEKKYLCIWGEYNNWNLYCDSHQPRARIPSADFRCDLRADALCAWRQTHSMQPYSVNCFAHVSLQIISGCVSFGIAVQLHVLARTRQGRASRIPHSTFPLPTPKPVPLPLFYTHFCVSPF